MPTPENIILIVEQAGKPVHQNSTKHKLKLTPYSWLLLYLILIINANCQQI